ncbi:hypothetical protein PO909_029653 [Leuciscus waleckii]
MFCSDVGGQFSVDGFLLCNGGGQFSVDGFLLCSGGGQFSDVHFLLCNGGGQFSQRCMDVSEEQMVVLLAVS